MSQSLYDTDMLFEYILQIYDKTYSERPVPTVHNKVTRIENTLAKNTNW